MKNLKKIYFFNGWGMDENVLSHVLNTSDYEFEIVNFPYKINMSEIAGYKEIIFIAWSFGVYYLNRFLDEHKNIKYKKAIAINGAVETIGEYGINPKMFDLTLNTLNPENLLKFYKNMDIDENFKTSSKKFEVIKEELKYFKENYKIYLNHINYYIIGKYDRIIESKRQEKYCKERGLAHKILDFGHYPFSYFKDLKDIVEYSVENSLQKL